VRSLLRITRVLMHRGALWPTGPPVARGPTRGRPSGGGASWRNRLGGVIPRPAVWLKAGCFSGGASRPQWRHSSGAGIPAGPGGPPQGCDRETRRAPRARRRTVAPEMRRRRCGIGGAGGGVPGAGRTVPSDGPAQRRQATATASKGRRTGHIVCWTSGRRTRKFPRVFAELIAVAVKRGAGRNGDPERGRRRTAGST